MAKVINGIGFFVFVILISEIQLFSQNSVSTEKSQIRVSIDNEMFYIHVVMEGQTLASIAKTYDINEQEIIKNNPGSDINLYKGQRLKIPVKPEKENRNDKNSQTIIPASDSSYLIHYSKRGETTADIAEYYNINEDTLFYLNPGIKKDLKAGTVVKIPRIDKSASPEQLKIEEKTVTHQVKKDDTLPSLSKKYNVSISAIIQNNKELLWGGLKEGQTINILIIDTTVIYTETVGIDSIAADTIEQIDFYLSLLTNQQSYNLNNIIPFSDSILSVNPIKLTLLLPFNYSRIVELNTIIDTCENKEQVRWAKRRRNEVKAKTDFYTDFYLGVLLALDSVKNRGIHVNIDVYDTEGDSNVVRYLINKHNLKNTNILIAPLEIPSINMILEYLGNTNVKIVLPVKKNKVKGNYKNVFYLIPSEQMVDEHYAYFIAKQFDKNIVLISSSDSISKYETQKTKNNIIKYMDFFGTYDSTKIKLINSDNISSELLKQNLSDTIENFIGILTTEETFVSNLTRELYNLKGNFNISVMGSPGWIELLQKNNLNIDYLHELNIMYQTPFYYDYSKENVKIFLQNFRNQYKSEPYQQIEGINPVLFGYDISLYFLLSGTRKGTLNTPVNYKSLLTDFEFIQKDPESGFENVSVTFISYEKNFDVVPFKPYKLK